MSPSMVAFFKDESILAGLLRRWYTVMYVCVWCMHSIRKALKYSVVGEPYQFRWLNNKMVSQCCVLSSSVKAEKHDMIRVGR